MRRLTAVSLGLLASLALTASAQLSPIGKVVGTITESVHSRSSKSATVDVIRVDLPVFALHANADAGGHFQLDSLPAGRYMLQLASATLDSLELSLLPNEVFVIGGQTVQANFSLPTGMTIRDAICRGLDLGKGRGVVVGRGVDADTDQPLPNAKVVVSWRELSVGKSLNMSREERVGVVQTGARGEFRLCGVPTGSWLSIQLQKGDRAGGVARVIVSDDEGAVVRNLSLSGSKAPTIAQLDSMEHVADSLFVFGPDSSTAPVDANNTATVSGTVRGVNGQVLAGATVRIANTPNAAITDASGRYVLTGLPPGTQLLYVRRLGYAIVEAGVELRAGASVTRDLQLDRIVSLDSIRVVARGARYAEFEHDRGSNFYGKFFDADEIERRHPLEISDLISQIAGFSVRGKGGNTTVVSDLASLRSPGCSEVNVVVDGIEQAGINLVQPSQIAGLELYRDGATAPALYRSDCGLVIIWTKEFRKKPKAK